MRLPKRLNNIIDFLGIIIPLIVDLVMNIVSFSILAPDFLSRIAFIALAIMIVVFVPRAWSKRQFISYAIFVSVVVFADWSFTLATTGEKIDTTAAVTQDVELERLRGNIDKTELKIEDLHKQYYEARLKHTEQKATKNTLSAEDIFNAIPNAIKERRIIPLIVWFMVFLGVQLVVATSIDIKEERQAEKTSEPVAPVEVKLKQSLPNNITLEDVKQWVHGSYYHITNQGSNLILSMENFFRLLPNFSMNKYPVIRNIAEQNGVIDKFGHALIIDETEAVKKIVG